MSKEDASSGVQGFKMPHVFIVPPEEDETPTWCCFDAALPIDKQIQRRADFVDERTFDPSSPYDDDIAAMDAAIARRNMETRSIVDTLMSKDFNIEHAGIDSDSDLDWDSDNEYQLHNRDESSQPPSPNRSLSDVGNDSEIIEVMKVGRRKRYTFDGDEQTGPRHPSAINRSGTFKSRATKALRSFTGTLSLRSSKSRSNDILPPRSATSMSCQMPIDDEEAEAKQPKGSRVTRRLSQFFSPPSRSQPSLALVGSTSGQGSALTSPSQPILASQSTSSNHSEVYDFGPPSPHRSSGSRPTESRPTSPITSSTSMNKTFKRFAKFKLNRMFSFSSSSSRSPSGESNHNGAELVCTSAATDSGRATPTLQRKPSPSTSTSSESSGPQTPTTITEEAAPVRSRLTRRGTVSSGEDGRGVSFETLGPTVVVPPSESGQSIAADGYSSSFSYQSKISDSTSVSTTLSKASSQPLPPPLDEEEEEDGEGVEEGDVSYELKLDSLHFDDISFDVDRFVAD